ncbi:hypothetical protein LAC81_37855 (plasmid) [Ensifer adhaerens]|uniref:hypothetical protein n=1 Tax=Ensifer adhaerens TaxID=106592 RepID=UPI001CBE4015|nr:hypothetical protein [Ensifer adhaerens]MBZ7927704.1 hypothetical protein [Ensifer adhaerens]UAX98098.1 hypothetical protein LAC78_39155 [Ensifer adhaerens]UAY05479.1 hypothetical protein LAC80_37870 [Ensifer adhaerens]UAY12857.1 hypothetical protein LAC81_37855 [Ensifer adhaerens]
MPWPFVLTGLEYTQVMEKPEQRYFHVVICASNAMDKPVLLFGDLDERQLKKQFLIPYRTGGRLAFGAKFLNVSDLTAVKILETVECKEKILNALQEDSLRAIDEHNQKFMWTPVEAVALGWDEEDIIYADADVTHRYIDGPPGAPSHLRRVLGSRGFKVATGTLIFLAASAWFDLG